jgi:thioredoxin 1
MLYTNLIHLETAAELGNMIEKNENVLVVCGKMNPECVQVYRMAELLSTEYKSVEFCDMEFDNPESYVIHYLADANSLKNIPFIVYYKNSSVVNVTSGIQSKEQISIYIKELFLKTEKV